MVVLADWITRYRKCLLIVLLFSLIAPLCFITNVGVDNGIDVWLDHQSQAYQQYQDFLRRYGSDEFVVIALETDNPFDKTVLQEQKQLRNALVSISGVRRVLCLADVLPAQTTEVSLSESPLMSLLVSSDKQTVGLFVWPKRFAETEMRQQTVKAIQETVSQILPDETKVHLAGPPLLNVTLDDESKHSAQTFFPVAIGISLLLLGVLFKRPMAVLAVTAPVVVTVIWTIGLMGMCGVTLNMITATLPALLFVLALSNAIHLASRLRFYSLGTLDRTLIARQAVSDILFPASVSCFTTAAGFASLMVSGLGPLAQFGLFASVGMIISLPCTLIIVPALYPKETGSVIDRSKFPLRHWSAVIAKSGVWIVPVSLLLFILCTITLLNLQVESNVLRFFPQRAKIVQDYEYIANNLSGFYTVELDAQTSLGQENNVHEHLAQLARQWQLRPEVAHVLSMATFDEGSDLLEDTFRQDFRVVDGEKVHLRMAILVCAMDSTDFYPLLDSIEHEAQEMLSAYGQVTVTGAVRLLNDMQSRLITIQSRCFALAAMIVLGMIGLLLRSTKALLVSILPNLLPIVAVFAVMVYLDIRLDAATVMIASIVIGIAADDTIHFLAQYRMQRRIEHSILQAIGSAQAHVARPMLFTTLTAAGGFAVLLLAPFRPIALLGLFTGLGLLIALVDDLLILPSCIYLTKLWNNT